MVPITSLWLPILLSAVFVFVASAIIHMMLPYHKSDFKKMPSEDEVMAALRRANIPPGDYEIPRPDNPRDRGNPEFQEKVKQGPVALMTVFSSGGPSMGKSLTLWFLFSIIVGIFAAYIAGEALPAGTAYRSVFRFAGCTAFAGYSVALLHDSIWYGRAWGTTFKFIFDGLVYAALTGGTFGWLWPD